MAPAIEIENFSYRYADGTDAVRGISLSIGHGERVAFIGPNGAGKSTLLLGMLGFVKGSGRVLIDGIEVRRENTKKIRTLTGSVLQDPDEQLFMPTLFDDVAFGPLNMGLEEAEIRRRVEHALATVGLEGKGHRPPHHLSAGQKRAAAIATVLSMSPKIITMDEPDSSLDPRSRKRLVELLRTLTQTLVIASCNMEFVAQLCERVILIDGGKIVADGKAKAILSDAALMEEHGLEIVRGCFDPRG
ncbi:MAG: ATP-binding cassette domain-containing protein [Sedimentisphaerales bacterium]|nr:ATP-binding cassette domain-containing protein [Sedimentisphaerales bacterium]